MTGIACLFNVSPCFYYFWSLVPCWALMCLMCPLNADVLMGYEWYGWRKARTTFEHASLNGLFVSCCICAFRSTVSVLLLVHVLVSTMSWSICTIYQDRRRETKNGKPGFRIKIAECWNYYWFCLFVSCLFKTAFNWFQK